jgi:hypothetical protein
MVCQCHSHERSKRLVIETEQAFLQFMNSHSFAYERLEHPAVFTCAEADAHHAYIEAVSTKNLFLCDKKARRFFLAVTMPLITACVFPLTVKRSACMAVTKSPDRF